MAEQAASGDGEGTDDKVDESDAEEENEDKSVRVPTTSTTKSEYELTRDANIAKNRELLQKLEAEFPTPKTEKKKKGKASKREKGKNDEGEPSRFSTRIQGLK